MPKNRGKKVLFILIITLLAFFNLVSASYISISTSIEDVLLDDLSRTSKLSITNLGDETAYDVGLSLLLPPGFEADDIFIGKFNPNQPVEKDLEIRLKNSEKPGVYPAVLIIDYKDANLYSFSAISPFNIVLNQRANSQIIGVIDEVTLSGSDSNKLTLTLRNTGQKNQEVSITLFLPRELRAEQTTKTAALKSEEEVQIDFEVSSFSALIGSSYQVFASITYEDEGVMRSSFSKGVVKIEEEKSIFSTNILRFLLIVLVVIFIGYQFWGRKWKK